MRVWPRQVVDLAYPVQAHLDLVEGEIQARRTMNEEVTTIGRTHLV